MADSDPALPASAESLSLRERILIRGARFQDRVLSGAGRLSLHNKFWLSFAVVILAMTACTLFAAHELIQVRAERQIQQDASTSALTFQVLSQQQQVALSRKADLLATLADLREGDISTL